MITLEEYEKLNPRTELKFGDVSVLYVTPTTHTKWRVDSLFEKEPITMEWIAGFTAEDVLVDVGANVGMYTVWAAKTRGVRVYAFEPESQNFSLLNRNIFLNGLGSLVNAYCLAMSDVAGLSQLHLSQFMAGGSCHSLGEQVDFKHDPMKPAFSQGCVSARLDEIVQDHTHYALGPHTDTPAKVLSFLFYLPADDTMPHLGTSMYLPKDPTFTSPGSENYHGFDKFTRLLTMPYVPNTLFAFMKTPNAFHGVEPISEPDIERALLLYDIKVLNAPAAPAQPMAKPHTQFSF